jgi:hypothetical protein
MTLTEPILFSRHWAMPTPDTFNCPPIKDFVRKYFSESKVSFDPFARNSQLATYRNDINPNTSADYHMDAEEFCNWMRGCLVKPDLGLFDPPYSPRQISECYKSFGQEVTTEDTQNSRLYSRVRSALAPMISPGGIVLSFGWNSVGMGYKHGFEQIEIMLVCHGGAHNDTICLAERKLNLATQGEFL